MVLEKLVDIVAKKFSITKKETLTPTTRLREDLNVDSLDAVELIMELEETFNIQVSDQDATTLKTLGDIQTLIETKLKK